LQSQSKNTKFTKPTNNRGNLQHIATHCNTLQHTATPFNKQMEKPATHCTRYNTLQKTEGETCNTLQHTATHCNTLKRQPATRTNHRGPWRKEKPAAHCSTLQHTATHCNKLQHTEGETCNTDES